MNPIQKNMLLKQHVLFLLQHSPENSLKINYNYFIITITKNIKAGGDI